MAALFIALPTLYLSAQDDDEFDEDDIYTLSPFEVTTEDTNGYTAIATLGGTRVRTDYRDLSTPLSAITSQFLTDTGSTKAEDLLVYTLSTEVGGLMGNYGAVGSDQGAGDRGLLLRPDNSTRVRGLEAADNTRNYFLTEIPWDSYNVDQVEIQRGPNSILFGVGSPAGIINTITIAAKMDGNSGKVENQMGKFGTVRFSGDYNIEIIEDVLAVRVAAVSEDRKYRQQPAFSDSDRFFATATFRKQILPESWADELTIRASVETAKILSNNPRILPPTDGISLWFDDNAGDGVYDKIGWGGQAIDMFIYSAAGGGDISRGTDFEITDPIWLPGAEAIDSGDLNNGGIGFFYQNGSSDPFFVSKQAIGDTSGGLAADGSIDGGISNLPYASPLRVSGFNNYTKQVNKIDEENEVATADLRYPLANSNYYKDQSLTDATIFDFYNQLIDGDNKREHREWESFNGSIAQSFFDARFGFEFVYDKQNYSDWRTGVTWSNPYISVDVNQNLQNQWSQYAETVNPDDATETLIDRSTLSYPGFTPTAEQPYPNANAGSAFIGGNFSSNNRQDVDRTSLRLTGFFEFSGADFFDEESTIARIIGKHTFTGLLTDDETIKTNTIWQPSAVEYTWAYENSDKGANTALGLSTRGVTPIVYLSEPLFGVSSASGLNLGPINTDYTPSGDYTVDYFLVDWIPSTDPTDSTYVDPGAAWTQLRGDPDGVQADNPYNYAGRVTSTVNILNADNGDLAELITDHNRTVEELDSEGFVWQGKFFDGLLVPTYGWRRDVLKTTTYKSQVDIDTGIADTSTMDLLRVRDTEPGVNNSWGIVAHAPDSWMKNVPVLDGLSAYYNEGNNNKVKARLNYDGEVLANPQGSSVDYGIVLSMLDKKLTVKLGEFITKTKDADLVGGANLLGSNAYYLYNLEAWGAANSLTYLYGMNGLEADSDGWKWNWALIDDDAWGSDDAYAPGTDLWENHASTIAQKEAVDAFITGMSQEFFDNYDIPLDVGALQSAYAHYLDTGDISQVVAVGTAAGFAPSSGTSGLSSQNFGTIDGIAPNGTIDSTSKGYELEINYRPVPNWNIQLNASKTNAYREDLGQPMLDFIEAQWARIEGPAGDIRLWWGGDYPIRDSYEDNIMSALSFQQESVGALAPELRPYNVSLVTNYAFSEGVMKGFNVGGSVRYQDAQILGYGLKDDYSALDINKPIYGEDENHFDLWAGFERPLSDKVHWRIQLNLRNVGENVGLVPISVSSDGTVALQRIAEGMTWTLTNTFTF